MFILNPTTPYSITGEQNQLVAGVVSVVAILAATVVYYALRPKADEVEHEFPKLRGIQLYHAWSFFERRYDFLHSNFERNPGKSFSFDILHHKVIALTGDDARHEFYSNPHLDLTEGYKILLGAIPRIGDVQIGTEVTAQGGLYLFNKKLNKLVNGTRLQNILPTLLQDITGRSDRWGNDGKSGRIDPFNEVYDLVFLLTARITTCSELAKNEADLKRISEAFMTLQKTATPTALFLPWFPGSARKMKKKATTELYTILRDYVEARRVADPTSDPIDVLIADGETTPNIVRFIMSVLFAGIVNAGIISCWMLIHLATNAEWRGKCKEELEAVFSRHLSSSASSATINEKLAAIPVSAWEDELPTLDACTRESQRMTLTGFALRRNLHGEMKIDGRVVRRGDFLGYSLRDVHLNPGHYPDPNKYDPGRWLRPDPVSSTVYPFVGWGAGRHPCSGMRMAKLEMKLILVMFLTRYEYELVDEDGKLPDPLPYPNKNNIHQARPVGRTCYLDFRKVAE